MLSKTLKQDILSILPIWLFLSVIALCSSLTLGGGVNLLYSEASGWPNVIGVLLLIFTIMVLSGYFIATFVFVGVRFYRNFYTDEGYLTFTLPVRRSTLYFSKVLSGVIFMLATSLVVLLSVSIGLLLVPANETSSVFGLLIRYLWELLRVSIQGLKGDFGSLILIVLGVILAIGVLVYEVLIMYLCITIGSVIAKKHKLLLSIVCYYGINVVMSSISSIAQLVIVIFSPFIAMAIAACATVPTVVWANLVLLAIVGFMIVALSVMYYETRKMIENKLNLP